MLIRFTAYLNILEKDIRLYIVQDNNDLDSLRFDVQLIEEGTFDFSLCRENHLYWRIITKDVPVWVKDELQPVVISRIEQAISI